MAEPRRIEFDTLKRVLMGDDDSAGVFERALGFRAATKAYKGVHLMNDVAQTLLGGAPSHGGDFLCRVIRLDAEGEDNSDGSLRTDERFGAAFDCAFPVGLGHRRIEDLRRAAATVLNFDGGVYQPGTQMASALASHKALLGFEGFRRFELGPYLAAILAPEGRERLKAQFESARDPVSRAFRPLLIEAEFVDRRPAAAPGAHSPFDVELGRGLSTLLAQPLSKPALLRGFVLASSLGLVLKLLGLGRDEGRPLALALAAQQEGTRPLRSEAVVSFRRGLEAFNQELAKHLIDHPRAKDLQKAPLAKAEYVEVRGGSLTAAANDIIEAARSFRPKGETKPIYWPDEFIIHFGRRVSCVHPRVDKAGWGKHLALTPELLETLALMTVPRGAPALPWAQFWRIIRDRFGLIVGANACSDVATLDGAGVHNVSAEELSNNAELLLAQGVTRGIARRLPDGGAEVGGELS